MSKPITVSPQPENVHPADVEPTKATEARFTALLQSNDPKVLKEVARILMTSNNATFNILEPLLWLTDDPRLVYYLAEEAMEQHNSLLKLEAHLLRFESPELIRHLIAQADRNPSELVGNFNNFRIFRKSGSWDALITGLSAKNPWTARRCFEALLTLEPTPEHYDKIFQGLAYTKDGEQYDLGPIHTLTRAQFDWAPFTPVFMKYMHSPNAAVRYNAQRCLTSSSAANVTPALEAMRGQGTPQEQYDREVLIVIRYGPEGKKLNPKIYQELESKKHGPGAPIPQ